MEQVTVKELASEFDLKSSIVISELKKIGVWVPSSTTPVDTDIANRIRKRLQMMVEAEQDEKEKPEKPRRAASGSKARRSIKELGKPRKRVTSKKVEEEEQEPQPLRAAESALKPRKGRRSTYLKMEALKEDIAPQKSEVTIEDEPVIEKVEAQAPEEALAAVESQETVEELAEVAQAETVEEAEIPAEGVQVEATPETQPVGEAAEAPAQAEEVPAETAGATEAEAAIEAVAEAAPTEGAEAAKPEAAEVPEAVETAEAEASPVAKPEEAEKPQRLKKSLVLKRKKKRQYKAKVAPAPTEAAPEKGGPPEVFFSEKVTVKSFAEQTGLKSNEVIRALMQFGMMVNMNQLLDQSTVEKLCEKFDIVAKFATFEEVTAMEEQVPERPEDLEVRAPVVTVMGHVDHGKTTLLDHIRHTHVAEGETGGITQHIGAYQVETHGKKIVFIDTPGHEAFTRMRARGAQVTDIVILVVAADDGVMPQTLEAIDHAGAANVPIIVAVNKIDKPGSQPDRVKQQLSDRGLVPEGWGGDTIMVDVSAKEGTNVDLLLEMVLLVAEMQELRANPSRAASGVILEAKMEKGRGTVATLLVQNGTLRVGDNFIGGSAYGRVRAMFDDRGDSVDEVGPSSAVEVLGLQGIPQAGDAFQVIEDAGKAREMVEFRQEQQRQQELSKSAKVSLDDLYAQLKAGEIKELYIVLKGDTQGTVEVLEDTLQKLSTGKVKVEIIHKGVGAITESDVLLASASQAIVIGFNVRPEPSAKAAAEHEDVEIRHYGVIYDVSREIEQAMLGLLEPTIAERYQGRAEVRETFRVPKVGTVAGSYVQDGQITRGSSIRLLRDNVVIYEGRLGSLKRFKDDVGEVRSGYECGISIANFNDIKVGDVIEAFVREEVAPQLS
jgi:translation initiation factor IF-2